MLLHEPPPSQADIHFRLFGFPVRIHPFFWLVGVLLGLSASGGEDTPPEALLIWIAVVLVSILVHECGHAFMQRHFGGHPWITLHSFGGLASCDDCDRAPRSQILISLAGPGAGFALATAVLLLLRLSGHRVGIAFGDAAFSPGTDRLPLGIGALWWEYPTNLTAALLVWQLLWVNILWGMVNLLPIYPLDGGQVSREVCTLGGPSRGIVLSLQISMYCAGGMAVVGALFWQRLFIALMFGFLSYSNYRALEAYRSSRW